MRIAKRGAFGAAGLAALALAAVTLTAGGASAAVTEIDIGFNLQATQTGASTLGADLGYFAARASLQSSADYGGVGQLSWPGSGSPQTLMAAPGPELTYQVGYLPVTGANSLYNAFPTGNYVFGFGNPTAQLDSIDYTATAYSNTPMLTPMSYAALTGARAGQSLAVDLASALDPGGSANQSYVFVTLFDQTAGTSDAIAAFAPENATSFAIPSADVVAGDNYDLEVDFSDRIASGPDANGVYAYQLFDTRTEVYFTPSAAPEPAAWALALAGMALVGGAVRSRRGRPARA